MKDGRRIALEVETGKSDPVGNIRKCLDAGFDNVITIATNTEVKSELRKKLLGFDKDRVSLLTAQETIQKMI